MKKIKIIFNALAITVAIIGSSCHPVLYARRLYQPQYIPVNNTMQPVGDFGIDYNCYDTNIVWTFYKPDSVARPKEYLPYRKGQYVPLKK